MQTFIETERRGLFRRVCSRYYTLHVNESEMVLFAVSFRNEEKQLLKRALTEKDTEQVERLRSAARGLHNAAAAIERTIAISKANR